MNARLKFIVNGVRDAPHILVVNSVDEYHSFPIHRQIALTGFDPFYDSDGCQGFLAKYGDPLPGVFYFNGPFHFKDSYNQILDIMNDEFGEKIKNDGSIIISWDDLLNTYLKNIRIQEVPSDALEADAEGMYANARVEGKMISSRVNDLRKDQKHIDDLLKDSKLSLLSVREQDVLFTYAVDKFNPLSSPNGSLVFNIGGDELTPKVGGRYNSPGTSLHFENYRAAEKQIFDALPKFVESKCASIKGGDVPKTLSVTIPVVVVLDNVETPAALCELQKEREPISRLMSPPFIEPDSISSDVNNVLQNNFGQMSQWPEINIKTHFVYAGVDELTKHKQTLESLGTNFWPDFNSNPCSKYRIFLQPFLNDGLVFVMDGEVLTPVENTKYTFDSRGMLSFDGVPEM